MKQSAGKQKKREPSKPKLNPHRKPDSMSVEEWQVALRRQAAIKEELRVRPVDYAKEGYFTVINPGNGRRYTVVYRGPGSSWNYCSCPDFKTSRLGTCKHLEAVEMASAGKYVRKRYALPDRSTIYLDYKSGRRIRIRLGGERREQLAQLASGWFDRNNTLYEHCYGNFGEFMAKAVEIDPYTKCFDDALEFIIRRREDARRAKLADENPDMPEGLLKVRLYPYQEEGAKFAFRRGRCVIADEMGLGKTVQAIAGAMLLKKYGFVRSVWIVCPTSLKYQWKNEITKFTGDEALVVRGGASERAAQLAADTPFFKIISYQSLVNTLKYGVREMPDMVVYDEVQRLKNWDTKMAKAMRTLKSDYVVALSGTPLENRLSELYSVMQLVDQFALGPYWQFMEQTTSTDETGKVTGYKNLNKVGETVKSLLIRRTKKSVRLQMPSRIDKNLFVPITKEQLAIHNDCKWNVGILMSRWRRLGFLPEKDRLRLMTLLSTMRMVCDSTFVLDQKTRHDTKVEEVLNIVGDVIDSGDEKIVIFSQWERMQRVVASELQVKGIGFRFLHGGVPSDKRGELISDFMTDPKCRVFLSTDAGSTGLNLQAASIVINLDLPWNPAVLEQRIARVYRLGQNRQVQVINMVAVDTIEQNMLGTLAFKTDLFEGVLDGGEDAVVLNDKKFERIAELVDTHLPLDENEEETIVDTQEEVRSEEIAEEYEDIESDTVDDTNAPEQMQTGYDAVSSDKVGEDGVEKELVAKGMEFLGGLAKALSSKESRERLVDSLVKEDPETGKTTLSIPVENKETVGNIVEMMAGFLKGLRI